MSEQLLRNLTDTHSESAAITWTNWVRPLLVIGIARSTLFFHLILFVTLPNVPGHAYDQQQCGNVQYGGYHEIVSFVISW